MKLIFIYQNSQKSAKRKHHPTKVIIPRNSRKIDWSLFGPNCKYSISN